MPVMRLPVDTHELDAGDSGPRKATWRVLSMLLLMLAWPAGMVALAHFSPGPVKPQPYVPPTGQADSALPATDSGAVPSSKAIWYPPTEGHVKLKLIVPPPDQAAAPPAATPPASPAVPAAPPTQ